MVILNGCVKGNCNNYKLPQLPLAGPSVADELEVVCSDVNQCRSINNWLNELYLFKQEYDVYREQRNGVLQMLNKFSDI